MSEKRHCQDLQVFSVLCSTCYESVTWLWHCTTLRCSRDQNNQVMLKWGEHFEWEPSCMSAPICSTCSKIRLLRMSSNGHYLLPHCSKSCSCMSPSPNCSEIINKYLPILLIWFWCSTGTALAVFTGHIAALPVWSVSVFQDVLDAEVPAIYARLSARSLRERACLGLQGARSLWRSAPAGRQHVDPNPVHSGVLCGKQTTHK